MRGAAWNEEAAAVARRVVLNSEAIFWYTDGARGECREDGTARVEVACDFEMGR